MENFFDMGGHGTYIWGAYGSAAVILGGLALASLLTFIKLRKHRNKRNEP